MTRDRRAGGSSTSELQRKRILDAVVEVVAERGPAGASVGLVIARAGVSSRTFYECFGGLEECLIAVLDGALERAAPLVVGAFDDSTPTQPWQEGMRGALGAMLDFFDEEPALTRVCLVELGTATPVVREHRERILAAFAGIVVARIGREVSHPSPLAAEGTFASVVGIVNARLNTGEQPLLLELLGSLMGIIVGPFMDEADVAREIEQGDRLARELLERRRRSLQAAGAPSGAQGRVEIPDVLLHPGAFRVRQCLLYVAERNARGPVGRREPSNREVGEGIGVAHRGQVGALLAQLARLGLLAKRSGTPGHPNAWRLTAEGELVVSALRDGRYVR
jgi:AcrR family transcriptional regulator